MATCYCRENNAVLSQAEGSCAGAVPCSGVGAGGHVQCCGAGSSCGSNGFCFFDGIEQDSDPDSELSGYYMGGCTDPAFADPACPHQCTDLPTQDVVYLPSQKRWACCASADLGTDCTSPSNETFNAPSPDRLSFRNASSSTAASSASATKLPSTTVLAATSPSAATSTASTAPSNPVPVTTIVLATVFPVAVIIAVVLLAVLLCQRRAGRRKTQQHEDIQSPYSIRGTEMADNTDTATWVGSRKSRVSEPTMSELDPEPTRY